MTRYLLALLLFATSCNRGPKPPVDPELAAAMPAGAAVLAGIDLERLRTTPLLPRVPEPWRQASYVLAAYDGKDLVTAARVGARISTTGPAGAGAPPDLLRHATASPIWLVARGNATLPLTGNLANLNRLLHQTEYTTISARVGDRVDLEIAGYCRTPETAQHLEENLRAIVSLMGIGGRQELPLDVRREGSIVRATGSATLDAVGKLF